MRITIPSVSGKKTVDPLVVSKRRTYDGVLHSNTRTSSKTIPLVSKDASDNCGEHTTKAVHLPKIAAESFRVKGEKIIPSQGSSKDTKQDVETCTPYRRGSIVKLLSIVQQKIDDSRNEIEILCRDRSSSEPPKLSIDYFQKSLGNSLDFGSNVLKCPGSPSNMIYRSPLNPAYNSVIPPKIVRVEHEIVESPKVLVDIDPEQVQNPHQHGSYTRRYGSTSPVKCGKTSIRLSKLSNHSETETTVSIH